MNVYNNLMKYFIKAYFNEMLIIIISFFLYFIGILYSNDIGFYSREFMSSGGDDFDIFISMTKINLIGIIFGILNLIINLVLLKLKNKIINISYIIYITLFIIQLFTLFLINLDTSLLFVFFTFDLFSIWFLLYIFGTSAIILSNIMIKKLIVNIDIINLNIIHKIIIIIFSLMSILIVTIII